MDRIVVGIDGSESAQEALRWAIDEARRRDATVKVVYAWHQPFMSACGFIGEMDPYKEEAQHLLDAAVDGVDATGVAPIERKLVTGGAAQALIRAARGAALLVVGSRGWGGFTGLLLGSVSQHAAHYAPCPVVIIPAAPNRASDHGPRARQRSHDDKVRHVRR